MTILARSFETLRRGVEEGLVPGAAAAAGTPDVTLLSEHMGWAQLQPRKRRLRESMRFDVASLTKVVVTTTLVLQAIERGDLFLHQRVAAVVPEFGAAGKEDITVRQLLTHTSGLPAWQDLTTTGRTRASALQQVWETPLARPAGTEVIYSDLGFITLGVVLERVTGTSLEKLAQSDVFDRLGMKDTGFRPPAKQRVDFVTTEVIEQRNGAITGIVHDDNALTLGGVSGHAGLFTTLADLELFCRAWLREGQDARGRLLSAAAVKAAIRDQTGGVDRANRRGLGWVLQPNGFWPAADLASTAAYSHTGFTGTSIVIDPERGLYAILLTNRVHPTREAGSADRVRILRARFHNAVWSELS